MAEWYRVVDENGEPDNEGIDRLASAWEDAPTSNLEVLSYLLDTAREQVTTYAPEPGDHDDPNNPPDRYVLAQLRQLENLWNAGRVSSAGDIGVDTYTFTPRPLDKTIRQIIRPVSSYGDLY